MNTQVDMENNNNNEHPKSKSKFITIIGLVIVLVILAWSATQIVKIFPNAVSSLASLAESVYTFKPNSEPANLEVKNSKNVINTGETISISWKNDKSNGAYSFQYDCKDGVTIDLNTTERDFKNLSCNQSYDLGLVDTIEIKVSSSKQRFVDTGYTLSYFKKNSNSASMVGKETISIINPDISEFDSSNNNKEENVDGKENVDEKDDKTEPEDTKENKPEVVVPKPDVSKPTEEEPKKEPVSEEKPVVSKPLPPKVPEYIYEVPVSNPNGQIDLVISNLQVGQIDKTGRFVKTDRVIKNQAGAIQFTVHNIGQKTSNSWTFKADILSVVNDYKSEKQTALKPNERAVTTIVFPASKNITPEIKIEVSTTEDKNTSNNKLVQNIFIVR